jgi:hypothetical protein
VCAPSPRSDPCVGLDEEDCSANPSCKFTADSKAANDPTATLLDNTIGGFCSSSGDAAVPHP